MHGPRWWSAQLRMLTERLPVSMLVSIVCQLYGW